MSEQEAKLATGILTVDLNAIQANYKSILKYCLNLNDKAVVSAVVKANGYGLGMIEVSQALFDVGCKLFFVATPYEGIELRRQLPDVEIFILDGLFIGQEVIYEEFRLIPCLASTHQVIAWRAFGKLPCVVHFNTGINRLGMALEDFKNISAEMTNGLNIHHIMSHFASADLPLDEQNTQQIAKFELIAEFTPGQIRSFGNSPAIVLQKLHEIGSNDTNILRPGLALWGCNPFDEYEIDLKPVVSLSVRVLQISDIDMGDMVGYVHLFTAQKPVRTAIIAVGYADGLFRQLSSATGEDGYFYFKGQKLPLLGKISMDMIVVDISALPDGAIDEGDFVEAIGKNISVDMVANWADTISYEVLTSLGNRYMRKYING